MQNRPAVPGLRPPDLSQEGSWISSGVSLRAYRRRSTGSFTSASPINVVHRRDFRTPAEVVSWLGAVQSQDFAGAKWALGLRARALTDADVDRAFDAGAILRTHVLRPTWHFVAPADIRWMLALTAPRVQAVNAYYYRSSSWTTRTFRRSRRLLERALQAATHLTRAELAAALARAGIAAGGLRLALPGDARRAGRRDLQRPAARQAVHLCAARRARAAGRRR